MDALRLAKKLAVLGRIYALGLLNEDEYTKVRNRGFLKYISKGKRNRYGRRSGSDQGSRGEWDQTQEYDW